LGGQKVPSRAQHAEPAPATRYSDCQIVDQAGGVHHRGGCTLNPIIEWRGKGGGLRVKKDRNRVCSDTDFNPPKKGPFADAEA
jgi:hypothetical protein